MGHQSMVNSFGELSYRGIIGAAKIVILSNCGGRWISGRGTPNLKLHNLWIRGNDELTIKNRQSYLLLNYIVIENDCPTHSASGYTFTIGRSDRMTRHGKNNTASSVFTHAERMMTGNGSKTQRFTSDSMVGFDACRLCLNSARDPRVDSEGHLFCHECILEHILGQKKDLKRQRAMLERMSLEEEAERKATLAAARERVLQDFERAQAGISTQTKISSNTPNTTKSSDSLSARTSAAGPRLEELTTAAERAALETLEREALASRRAKLPNFWLPSLTPSAPPTRVSALPSSQLRPLCHVSNRKGENRAHPIKLSDLVAVYFEAELTSSDSSSKKNSLKCCAGCRKALNKNTKLAVLKPCGHVVCLVCVNTLVKPNKTNLGSDDQCPKCDKPTTKVIEIEREGTGFAAGGMAQGTKFDVSFQG
ncbi:uncharacterized protein PGTG_14273 [Puccinia graminis f. sp. tritici CRL 75-36-700-3]|uniref:RING-type domain-containing protein n=2 Tax=Puccinia graminis f. sp. tritici TaxID=56615 RepID=E3KV94_PUCGT|nr:uncharacterized protein PGTG_14273 [Puccinia graminis f. sp. tritici CRL 75-36-700-3]EFP88189.2 hypothetical protein PGTG_14273 [Puccinia graminis f. sp. tritici CRL 75-36-700-3]